MCQFGICFGLEIDVHGVGLVTGMAGITTVSCAGVLDIVDPTHDPGTTPCSFPEISQGESADVNAVTASPWQFSHWAGSCMGTAASTSFAVAPGIPCEAWFVLEPSDGGPPDAASPTDGGADAAPSDGGSCLSTGSFCFDPDGGAAGCCSGTCYASACCLPAQATGCAGQGTPGGCCQFYVPAMGANSSYLCEQGKCCVPSLNNCNTDGDCCAPYPCTPFGDAAGHKFCCLPNQAMGCAQDKDCCLAYGAAAGVCNGGKCCLQTNSQCTPGSTNECCSGMTCPNGGFCP
jgi:hypothetical protein